MRPTIGRVIDVSMISKDMSLYIDTKLSVKKEEEEKDK
jgi:hypothetical protein